MASNAFSATELQEWVPEYQSAKAQIAYEKALVIGKQVDRSFEALLKFGDTLNIPKLANFGVADNAVTTADLTLDVYQTLKTSIAINQWKYKAFGVSYKEQVQNYPEFLTQATVKCSYSVALAVDTYLAELFGTAAGEAGFTNTVGTEGSALTDDVMLAAKEYLDLADVPYTDRVWDLDPESITDLMKIDKFLRDDYVARGAVESENGLIGKSIYGGKIYLTNNLRVLNTSYHLGALMHREAIAMIQQKAPTVEKFDWWQKFTNVVRVQCIFGAALVRADNGVRIKTRS